MDPIICSNNVVTVLDSLRNYLGSGKKIQDIHLVESNNKQVVFLVSDKLIPEGAAAIWWNGYSEGLKIALES